MSNCGYTSCDYSLYGDLLIPDEVLDLKCKCSQSGIPNTTRQIAPCGQQAASFNFLRRFHPRPARIMGFAQQFNHIRPHVNHELRGVANSLSLMWTMYGIRILVFHEAIYYWTEYIWQALYIPNAFKQLFITILMRWCKCPTSGYDPHDIIRSTSVKMRSNIACCCMHISSELCGM